MISLTSSLYIADSKTENKLSEHLKQTSSIEILHTFKNELEVIEHLNRQNVDILFISQELESVLQNINLPPFVIAICQHPEKTINPCNNPYFDILSKPIEEKNLCSILGKLLKIANRYKDDRINNTPIAAEDSLLHYCTKETIPASDYIFIKTGKVTQKVMYDNILYVKKVIDEVHIFTSDNNKICVRSCSLKKIYNQLPPERFVRINKSVIINYNKIGMLNNRKIWIGPTSFDVSRIYVVRLNELLRVNK